jgi:MFS family permease
VSAGAEPIATGTVRRDWSFYGWSGIVVAVFFILMTTNGLTVGGIAAFDPYLIKELGVGRGDIKFGDLIQLAVTAVLTIATGWAADRIGVRPIMALGVLSLALGFFLVSRVTTLQDYYWARFFMGLGLAGAGLAICVVAVSRWFFTSRGLALGIVLAGTSLGNALFPIFFTQLIERQGWRSAVLIACGLLLLLLPVVLLVIKEWPKSKGLKPFGAGEQISHEAAAGPELSYAQIISRPAFWLLGIAAFGTFYTILGVNNNMIMYMRDLQVSPTAAAAIAIPIFIAGLVSKFLSGWFADLLGRKPLWLLSLLLMVTACAMLATLNKTLVVPAALMLGFGWGANYTLLQALAGDVFGTRSLGRVMGAITVLDAGGGALGPWVTGVLFDQYGSYRVAFLVTTALCLLAGVMAALLRVPRPGTVIEKV